MPGTATMKKRENAIHERFVLVGYSELSGKFVFFQKVWKVSRWSFCGIKTNYIYTKDMAAEKKDVLAKIDTDSNPFGIADVDPVILPDKIMSKEADQARTSYKSQMHNHLQK